MKPTKIAVSYGEKRSINYQSAEARITLVYEVETMDDAGAAYKEAKSKCISVVDAILTDRMAALAMQ